MLVLSTLPEVPKQPQPFGELGVAGDDRTTVAVRAEILTGIKAEAAGVAEGAHPATVPARAVRLARILDHEEPDYAR